MSGLQFKPELARKIMRGEKTQTRRPVKGDQPPRWKPGRTYAVQPGRGKPSICRIVVDEIRLEPVGQITFEDARREGFRTTDEFKAYWVRLYDGAWLSRCEQNRNGEPMVEFDLVERFCARHAERPVWVVSFHLDHAHVPRLLAARPAPDYVTDPRLALPGEPEALTEDDWERHVQRRRDRDLTQWQEVEHHQREQDRRLLSIEQRMARMRREAHMRGVDISRELWLLNKRLPGLSGTTLERHIRGVETKIYRIAA